MELQVHVGSPGFCWPDFLTVGERVAELQLHKVQQCLANPSKVTLSLLYRICRTMAVHIAALFAKVLVVAAAVSASTLPRLHPYRQFQDKGQVPSGSQLLVDLGYEIYEGVANATTGLNSWKG